MLASQRGHHKAHVQVLPVSALSCQLATESRASLQVVARGMGCLGLQTAQLCVHFLPATNMQHQLSHGYAHRHLLSGKPSPALPSLTTWVLLQLNETEEPCMVRMDLTWGTLPATI